MTFDGIQNGSNMNKLFVTGGSGLLGANIIQTASNKFEVFGSYNNNKVIFENYSLYKIDLTDKKQLKIIEKLQPDLIIHCAAFVSVDGCEKDLKKAYLHNVVGTENVVNISEKIGNFLIHISTDAVFDGKKGDYSEEDKANPINVYGKTKLQAEEIVGNSNIDHCIIRTNIYGWNKRDKFSLAEWMVSKLENGEELFGFYDVKFTPILVNNLSRALFEIYEKKIKGILNVTGSESCTKLEFAQTVADVFNLNKSLVRQISIDELSLPAKRGKNLSLNIKKAQSLLATKLLNVKDGLQEMKRLKDKGYVKKLRGI